MNKTMFVALLTFFALNSCSKLSEEEMLNKAIEAQKASQFNEALEGYEQFLQEYPKSVKVPEALYAMGSIYQSNKRDLRKAVDTYKRIVRDYPEHATASSASFLVGFIFNNELKNSDSAKMAYEEFLKRYPSSPMAPSARFELDNLGKDPEEIIKPKLQSAEKPKPSKAGKPR